MLKYWRRFLVFTGLSMCSLKHNVRVDIVLDTASDIQMQPLLAKYLKVLSIKASNEFEFEGNRIIINNLPLALSDRTLFNIQNCIKNEIRDKEIV